ncbi:DUF6484 domain-containing protein [Variovorax dokdonensis]|uniref:DUF6484 domain-containing protein n=1 Tax=Variovorax dokdonensis TaxID=344883 RepID=A0ABT7NAJ7_9BURK|nr:DUF6484 domain-containing protein [Variovorax dokdonensis]MDM0044963.1 DUF6484 domain-containing protein [Variovorax dokdonensis]
MGASEVLFKPLPARDAGSELQSLLERPHAAQTYLPRSSDGLPTTARFHGFDLQGVPLLSGLRHFPGELVRARTTVTLRTETVGSTVLVLCEDGDWTRAIIVGVVQDPASTAAPIARPVQVEVHADDDRLVLSAQREIVLKCGAASITLTRAGKVLIEGNYVMSRSTGYNKIKGAAIDIN